MKKILFGALASLILANSYAWEPTKPITALVGFAPGSGNELSFRGISSIVEKNNPTVTFIVENKPGASGVIAANDIITRPADGYNLYVPSNQGIFVTANFFHKNAVKYAPEDFEYVLGLAKSPLVLIASKESKINKPDEFISKVKNVGSVPVGVAGGSHRLAFDYITHTLSLKKDAMKIVQYKGPAQVAQDIAGGHLEFAIIPAAVAATLINADKIKVIGVCSERIIKGFENYPLMNNYVPGMNVYGGWGIVFPKGTPADVIEWYTREFSKAIKSAEVQAFFEKNYMFADDRELTPLGFKQSMDRLRNQWAPVLQTLVLEK